MTLETHRDGVEVFRPLPYDIPRIKKKLIQASLHHAQSCRNEIIDLRTRLMKAELENKRLKEQLNKLSLPEAVSGLF